jgi:hypothetical protein
MDENGNWNGMIKELMLKVRCEKAWVSHNGCNVSQ